MCSEVGAKRVFTAGATEVVVAPLYAPAFALRALSEWLSPAEQARAARFHSARDRRRFIVARARLRELLGQRLGVPPESVQFVYRRNGKPALAAPFADTGWRFNVSHCDDAAVYAFSQELDVGVDIEALRELRDADDIAARFFSRQENDAYRALPACDKPLAFFSCWTRKEAFVKALGEGLRVRLDQFDVSLVPGEPARLLRLDGTLGDPCGWHLESFFPLRGFIGALATQRA